MNSKIQPLTKLLNESLRKLNEQASLLEQASRVYAELLPSKLHASYQIAGIKNNEIIITTNNPQARYTLTQFSHDFIRKLQKLQSFTQITKVSIKVDLKLEQTQRVYTATLGSHLAKAKRPSPQAAALIQKISQGIEHPELAAALSKLAQLSKN